MTKEIKSIILAAGKGSRMESTLPKVLLSINNKPMIKILLNTLNSIEEITENIIVIGKNKDKYFAALGQNISYVTQKNQLGTAHAVKMAKEKLENFNGDILIVNGDCPLLSEKTIKELIKTHNKSKTVCTVLTTFLDNPTGYGRIIKKENSVLRIVEDSDASLRIKDIKEVNAGVYIVNSKMLFKAIETIDNKNNQNEYYLTDIVSYFASRKYKVSSYTTDDILEIQGVNTKMQLEFVNSIAKQKGL